MLGRRQVQKLSLARPRTLREASQISGVTPSSVLVLLAHIRNKGGQRGVSE